MYEIIGAIIGPFVTALLAGMAVLGRQWQENKRSEADLEQLATEAAFLESWVAARERVQPLNPQEQQVLSTALERLDHEYRGVRQDQAKLRRKERTPAGVRLLRGVLMLDVLGTGAKVLRVFYWIALLFGILGTVLFIAVSTEPSDTSVGATIFAAAFLSLMCFVPAGVSGLVTTLVSNAERTKRDQRAALIAAREAQRDPHAYLFGYPVPPPPPQDPRNQPGAPTSAPHAYSPQPQEWRR